MDEPGERRFVLLDADWGPDEATTHRNLGCPQYNECLSWANDLLIKQSGRSARNKRTWKLALRDKTWACSPDCPDRKSKETFQLALLHSPQDPDNER